MQLAKSSVVAFVVAALLVTAAKANTPAHHETHPDEGICYEPIEGEWSVDNIITLPGGETQLDGVVTLDLAKAADSVYNGTGFLDVLVPTPVYDIPVVMVGLFDPEACVLSGTIHAEALNASLVFRWNSIGSQASGPYLLKVNGVLTSTVPGLNKAKYVV